MKKLLFGLLILSCSFMSVSFADFQSERGACSSYSSNTSCYDKVRAKYLVSKKQACKMKNDVIVNRPIEANRPKEKVYTHQFYKFNDQLLYQIAVSSGNSMRAASVKSYMYVYNCKTQKAYNITSKFTSKSLSLGVEDYISQEEKESIYLFDFLKLMQNNGGVLFIDHFHSRGIPSSTYYLFDFSDKKLTLLELEKFVGFDIVRKRFLDSLEGGQGGPAIYISSVDKKFNGFIHIGDFSKSKINLLTKTITIEK